MSERKRTAWFVGSEFVEVARWHIRCSHKWVFAPSCEMSTSAGWRTRTERGGAEVFRDVPPRPWVAMVFADADVGEGRVAINGIIRWMLRAETPHGAILLAERALNEEVKP